MREYKHRKIRVKLKKLSNGAIKFVNYQLDVDMLNNIQSKVGEKQGDYMIVSYNIE